MSTSQPEGDITFNRMNVLLARHQRIVQSWRLSRAAYTPTEVKTDDDDNEELFKAVPDKLGLGGIAPQNELEGGLKRRTTSSKDALLNQILGKKAANQHRASKAQPSKEQPQDSRVRPGSSRQAVEESSDEEESRASMLGARGLLKTKGASVVKGKRRPSQSTAVPRPSHEVAETEQANSTGDTTPTGGKRGLPVSFDTEAVPASKKNRTSFLDQTLAEHARKNKKKKKSKLGLIA